MATQTQPRPLDMDRLHALLGQAVGDMGAALHAAQIVIGDKLDLYRAMGSGEKFTPAELARRTGTAERYVREWLNANAASKYVEYDAATGTYCMTPEQSFALAQDDIAVHLPGFYHVAALGSLAACGGGSGGGGGGGGGNSGTTAGVYTFTVTATGNPAQSTGNTATFTVTVN